MVCNKKPRQFCEDDTCIKCYRKSFASIPASQYWSDRNDKTPRYVFKNTASKYWFNCESCKHEFEMTISRITSQNNWCPFCSNPPKKLCNDPSCDMCFERSFASTMYVERWSKKNEISPREIFKSACKKFYIDCPECGHDSLKNINNLTSHNRGCPYCAGQKICFEDNCLFCFKRSFASHPKSVYWSAQNKKTPRHIFLKTGKKYYFDCGDCDRPFLASPHKIAGYDRWCPHCKNKTEAKLYDFLISKYSKYKIIRQSRHDWCKKERHYPFDFEILELKILIELDGSQHFKQISCWTDPNTVRSRDIFKIQQATKHNYKIIHLLQEDVWNTDNNWENKLKNCIEQTKQQKCLFIPNDKNQYMKHRSDLDKLKLSYDIIN